MMMVRKGLGALCVGLLFGCGEGASSDTSDAVSGADDDQPVAVEPEPTEPAASVDEPEPNAVEPEASAVEPEVSAVEPEAGAEPEVGTEPEVAAGEPDAGAEPPGVPEDPAPTELEGVCGQRGEGTVDVGSFVGFEELYIIGDEGFGDDVCVVRFELRDAGEPPDGCIDLDGEACLWTHLVEYANPTVVTDEGGACAGSQLGLDAAGIEAFVGQQVAYGYVYEYVGHNSVILKHDEATDSWIPNGNANWDSETSAFRFDRRDGICTYQSDAP